MPETFQALMVLVVALLPGALYVWAFERFAGAWGVRFSDRVLRFVEVSAVLHAVAAPLSYWLWAAYIRSGRLVEGDVHTRESATHKSYAAGYPEEQDLYLAESVDVDPETGTFDRADGKPVARGSGILIRWSEVEYLEFIEA
jgi:hypothetical protein